MTDFLEEKSRFIEAAIYKLEQQCPVGHLSSCLSCISILTSLYYDSETLFDYEKDIFIFGKGHAGATLYPILVDLGYIEEAELLKYTLPEGLLKLYPDPSIPGFHFITGSLGNSLGYAAGLALAHNPNKKVFVLLGDAELYEGVIWESLLFISHHQLNNLSIIIDRNGTSILGKTEHLLKLEPLESKFRSFGFFVQKTDGTSFQELRSIFSRKQSCPHVIIVNTTTN